MNDFCEWGTCQGGEQMDCDDHQLNTQDLCDPIFGCFYIDNGCTRVNVTLNNIGSPPPAASYVVSVLSSDFKCKDLLAGNLPSSITEISGADFLSGIEVPCVPPKTTYTVFVIAQETCPFAIGCVDEVIAPARDTVVNVRVDLRDVDVSLDGDYTGVHSFRLTDVFPNCTGLTTPQECAAPDGLPFGKAACCYLGAIKDFFNTDAGGFASPMKAGAVSWIGGNIPLGKKADFDSAVDATMTQFLAANTPAWVAQYAAVDKGALPAVRQLNLSSTLTLQASTGNGEYPAAQVWNAYTIYWKIGCDPSDPLFFQCGRATYRMDQFGGGYSPVISPSSLTIKRRSGSLLELSEHSIAMNPGRLLAFVVNDVAANALTGGTITDGIFEGGAAENIGEAADIWIDCPTIATMLYGSISSWFTGTQQDIQTLCNTSVDALLVPVNALQTVVTTPSSLKVSGSGSWTDVNCDLKSDQFQSGEYTGIFQPTFGDAVGITGSFTAHRN